MQEKEYQQLLEEMIRSLVTIRFTDFSQTVSETVKGEGFVLGYLLHVSTAQPGDLSREMKASTAYVSKILRGMEEKGLILRSPDPDDKRKILLSLTGEGKIAAEKAESDLRAAMVAFLKSLGEEDAANFVRILSKIAGRARAFANGAEKTPP